VADWGVKITKEGYDLYEPRYEGVILGYRQGDLVFTPNEYGGSGNDGECDIDGTTLIDFEGNSLTISDINDGVAMTDTATDEGFIMYSVASVHTRFSASAPHADNADHFIFVKFSSGVWYYDNNASDVAFTIASTDILVARIKRGVDWVTNLAMHQVTGILCGYQSGNVTFTPNYWDGGSNPGDIGVTGSSFIDPTGATISIGDINYGIAMTDGGSNEGYIMYSVASVHTRFSASAPNANNADHLIGVRKVSTTWYYDNNTAWVSFSPISTDRLIGRVRQGIGYVGDLSDRYMNRALVYNSDYPLLKIAQEGDGSVTFNGEEEKSATITHNLGYVPHVAVMGQYLTSSSTVSSDHYAPRYTMGYLGLQQNAYFWIEVTTTTLKLFWTGLGGGNYGTIDYFYKIYYDEDVL